MESFMSHSDLQVSGSLIARMSMARQRTMTAFKVNRGDIVQHHGWEEIQQRPWMNLEEALREQHRNDLLQVLAYANLAQTPKAIACLAYPCSPASWNSMRERGRLIHRAELTMATRSVQLWLTALPMAADVERIAAGLVDEVQKSR